MASWIEKTAKQVSDFAKETVNKVVDDLTEGYQTPLEKNGIVMRQIQNTFSYYKPTNPYVRAYSNSLLKSNDSYVSASGWIPKTYDVKNIAIDLDNEVIKKDEIFDTQR
jgi:hypothetical protein